MIKLKFRYSGILKKRFFLECVPAGWVMGVEFDPDFVGGTGAPLNPEGP